MKYFRFGHIDKSFVKVGDKIKKEQKIATLGTGNGQWSGHLHFDVLKNKTLWTSYVFGWSLEKVKSMYADPGKYRKTVLPSFDHFGWLYLELATYGKQKCFHPGEDLNGKGAGNADVGDPIYSPVDGVVEYLYDGTGKNGGWGKLLVIKEIEPMQTSSDLGNQTLIQPVSEPTSTMPQATISIVSATEIPKEVETTLVTSNLTSQTIKQDKQEFQNQENQLSFVWEAIVEFIKRLIHRPYR